MHGVPLATEPLLCSPQETPLQGAWPSVVWSRQPVRICGLLKQTSPALSCLPDLHRPLAPLVRSLRGSVSQLPSAAV